MGDTKCMQNVMLVSQNAQLNCLASVLFIVVVLWNVAWTDRSVCAENGPLSGSCTTQR